MNSILDFYYMGGPLFMMPMTLVALTGLGFAVLSGIKLLQKSAYEKVQKLYLPVVLFCGSLVFVLGLFGQILGLYGAFFAIEQVGEVSQALLAGGLKVSSITTLYGFFCFLILGILWFALRQWRFKATLA